MNTIKIMVTATEVRSDFPEIVAESSRGREREAINTVKGACLHAIGDRSNVPDSISFEVYGMCRHCDVLIDGEYNCCASCADERGS